MQGVRTRSGRGASTLLLLFASMQLAAPPRLHAARHAAAGAAEDRASIFSRIDVTADRPAADVACAFCSVHIDGPVRGDVAVIFGHVDVESGQTISGDVATLFSSLSLGENAHLGGDVASAFGRASLAPGATVGGDRAIFSSGLGLSVLLAPLLILVGVVWLAVWALRRLAF